MKVLVIGSGAREHALVRCLQRDSDVTDVHVAPGNAGIAADAVVHRVETSQAEDVADLAARIGADLVVVGPEAPLVAGVSDAVKAREIACFGPSTRAVRLESSKAFAKEVMAAAAVPTAMAVVCDTRTQVEDALNRFGPPYVVKDDGLAAGKGVVVTDDRVNALAHAQACDRVVVEEYLDGPEVSLFCVTDGVVAVPLLPAQDFKRAHDGDAGPNTGGMGAYAPLSWLPDGLVEDVVTRVVHPTIQEMHRRDAPFAGLLYVGLALTSRGPRVVEFNARFGDPEAQAVLAMMRSGLSGLLWAAATQNLAVHPTPVWHDGAAVTVVIAAHGYPAQPRSGDRILGLDKAATVPGVEVEHAGTSLDADGAIVSNGGRVLSVTGMGANLDEARGRAYEAVELIQLDGSHYRRDIAARRW